MDEIIANLQEKYWCEDRACKKDICWPDAVSGEHIHLTFQHLHIWSSALVCRIHVVDSGDSLYEYCQQAKINGVTLDTPPNSKMFDIGNRNSDDLATISRQRNGPNNQNNSPKHHNFLG